MSADLRRAVRDLLLDAATDAVDPVRAAALTAAADRLEEPLRVAVAGLVKAGKSTLLNALLGEELAPTDAGECTRVVTWYHHADRPGVRVHLDGGSTARPFTRAGGALEVDLGVPADEVSRVEVGWPSGRLVGLSYVDTPGIASLSSEVSARTVSALTAQDGPAEADAVVYLLRHSHSSDVRFLESFADDDLARGGPVNAVGVLSRADEIGACRLDAMESAARVAERYRRDPRIRRLCPVVVGVSGLLGVAAATLENAEFAALVRLTRVPAAEATQALLTADRFVRPSDRSRVTGLTDLERAHLAERLGVFGLRTCVEFLRGRPTADVTALRAHLLQCSGLEELRSVLLSQFTERSQVLKVRTALLSLRSLLDQGACHHPDRHRSRAEEITASAHEFVEVRLLTSLRSGEVELAGAHRAELHEELLRLLGGAGHAAHTRLGVDPGDVPAAASSALHRWQRVAEHPLSAAGTRGAARVAVRTLEGLLSRSPA